MAEQSDIKSNFVLLEERIQNLIHLYEQLKKENNKLRLDKRQMTIELKEEKEKLGRMEEGYKNLKAIEKSSSKQTITKMKRKISDIILEIDKNMSLIEDKS